jgi:ubiquinol-cytochrome c reductase iron-sulfur subunit
MTTSDPKTPARRDFLYVLTGGVAGVGAMLGAWPLVGHALPARNMTLPRVIVDLAPISPGQEIMVIWNGQPVFIRHRTAADIETARAVALDTLRDPQARNAARPVSAPASDANRTHSSQPQWLVVIGICPHLGCKLISGRSIGEVGWFCPCHAARFDLSGRVLSGPAATNLAVPPYRFLSRDKLEIGTV